MQTTLHGLAATLSCSAATTNVKYTRILEALLAPPARCGTVQAQYCGCRCASPFCTKSKLGTANACSANGKEEPAASSPHWPPSAEAPLERPAHHAAALMQERFSPSTSHSAPSPLAALSEISLLAAIDPMQSPDRPALHPPPFVLCSFSSTLASSSEGAKPPTRCSFVFLARSATLSRTWSPPPSPPRQTTSCYVSFVFRLKWLH